MKDPKLKIGVIIVIIAWAFFATSYLISKIITNQTTVPTMLFFRFIVGTLFVLPWMLKEPKSSFKPLNPNLIFIRAIAGLINTAFIYLAVRTISLVDTTLLTNSAPLFVPILSAIWLKKKIELKIWISVLIGFVGIVFILHPDKEILNWGALLALGSGIATAISLITVRMAKNEKFYTVLFYMFFLGLIATIPFAILHWKLTPTLILPLTCLGILATLGQWGLFKALQYAGASHIAPFGYVSVIFSALFDVIFFNILPDFYSLIGVLLVVTSGIIIMINVGPKNKST